MSTTVLDRLSDAQATVLDAVDQTRGPAVGAVTRVVQVTDRLVPDLSTRRRRVMPTVGNVVDSQFTFVIELLKRQRANTKAVVKAAASKGSPASKVGASAKASTKSGTSAKA